MADSTTTKWVCPECGSADVAVAYNVRVIAPIDQGQVAVFHRPLHDFMQEEHVDYLGGEEYSCRACGALDIELELAEVEE